MGGVGAHPATRPDQPGSLQPLQHHAQQRIRPTRHSQPGAKLAQHRVVEAGVLQLQAQGVLPGDPVRNRLCRVPVGEVVQELQDRDHRQQRR